MSGDFWVIAGYFLGIFFFIAYFCALIAVVVDVFRDRTLPGGYKALWLLFLVFVPFLTVLVYVIARGKAMATRMNGLH